MVIGARLAGCEYPYYKNGLKKSLTMPDGTTTYTDVKWASDSSFMLIIDVLGEKLVFGLLKIARREKSSLS